VFASCEHNDTTEGATSRVTSHCCATAVHIPCNVSLCYDIREVPILPIRSGAGLSGHACHALRHSPQGLPSTLPASTSCTLTRHHERVSPGRSLDQENKIKKCLAGENPACSAFKQIRSNAQLKLVSHLGLVALPPHHCADTCRLRLRTRQRVFTKGYDSCYHESPQSSDWLELLTYVQNSHSLILPRMFCL